MTDRTWSFEDGKRETFAYIAANVPRDGRILDVGPGNGACGKRLQELGYTHVDAVEAWAPYVEEHGLKAIYENVLIEDVSKFEPRVDYELAIMGDVLEHLTVRAASAVLDRMLHRSRLVIVSLPWNMSQGAVGGNPFEEHRQPDLTPLLVSARYPALKPLCVGSRLGVYYAGLHDPPAPAPRMRVAHFAPFAPMACGLYEAARDMVRSDLDAGRDAAFVDVGVTINGQRQAPKPDAADIRRGFTLRPVPFEAVQGHDLFVFHDGVPDAWVVRTQAPILLMMHGQPMDCFKPELYKRGGATYSFFPAFAAWPRVKRLVTMWPEFMPFWQPIVPAGKLRAVDAPVCDQDHFRPEGDVHVIAADKRGEFNVLIAASWREIDPYEIVHGLLLAASGIPGLKVHMYAIEQPIGPWEFIFQHMRRLGIQGELCARMPGMDQVYRSMDLVLNPHRIATRIVMEALSCGTPLVGGLGCRWTPWTAPADNPELVADAVLAAHSAIAADPKAVRGEALSVARAFSHEAWQSHIGPVYEEALSAP